MNEPTDETNRSPDAPAGGDDAARVEADAAPATDAGHPEAQDAASGAVDTGRRVDPALLQPPSRTVRRDRPAPRAPDAAPAADAQEAAPEAARGRAPSTGGRGDDRGRGPRPAGRDGNGRGDRPRFADRTPRGPNRPSLDRGPAPVERRPTPPEEAGDFAAMLAESGPIDHVDVRIGDKVRAKCVHIGKDAVFFELSGTQEAHSPIAEFLDDDGNLLIGTGETVEGFVTSLDGGIVLSRKIAKGQIDTDMLEQARAAGIPVDGTVTGVNKGGLEVQLAGTRAFCPIGQADLHFVEDPGAFVGKTLSFLVREVKEGGRNVLLSRKALLERERKEKAEKLKGELAVGKILEGKITRIQPFGAFVDLGGMDGLIPVSELSHSRVADPNEVVKVGEDVRVEVMRIEDDPKRPGQLRIGLSLKALLEDPLDAHAADLVVGSTLVGRVARLETFGAFVELFPGVQGLVHVSEIADQRIRHPMDVLKVDEHVKVRILDVDRAAKRIALSIKDASERAEQPASPGAPREAGGKALPPRGAQVEGTVERIERYGVFVKLDSGVSALLPASETGTPRGSDLGKAFPIGTKLPLLVIDVDERGRVKVSKLAREQAEERAIVEQYGSQQKGAGFGTLGDLLRGRK